MRARCLIAGIASLAIPSLVQAKTEWLQSARLTGSEIAALCERVRDVRLLARMQMISSGSERWRKLSRQELVIESATVGVLPLEPRCYVIARAGPAGEKERRAFEVHDFLVSPDGVSVFVIGRAYNVEAPLGRNGR
ncbi:hypothetical protein ABEG18_00400 [Alsobacter sp. KACC 23698]|uniref:DUF4893 domain-containing protein n=1 Tax=Alsobacter sp. KACC 23698 TaxID=3149229 RepID=A0AAU7JGU6_9HYPH